MRTKTVNKMVEDDMHLIQTSTISQNEMNFDMIQYLRSLYDWKRLICMVLPFPT